LNRYNAPGWGGGKLLIAIWVIYGNFYLRKILLTFDSAGEKLLPTVDIMSTVEEIHGGHFSTHCTECINYAFKCSHFDKNIPDKSDNYSTYNAPIWIIFSPKCTEIHDAGHYDQR
jgi:hypothetical protein